MRTTFTALCAAAAAQMCAAQDGYCPPVLELESSWPMSRILKDVCKDGSGADGIDCRMIDPLIDAFASMAKPDDATNLLLAKEARGFLCDPCLDAIREGIVYMGDDQPKARITGDGALLATCKAPPGCMGKFQAIAEAFPKDAVVNGKTALSAFNKLQADCRVDPSGSTMAHDVTEFMATIMASLETVRAIPDHLMDLRQQPDAARLTTSGALQHPLRLAAYGCMSAGAALIVAAVIVSRRRRAATEHVLGLPKEPELL